MSIRMPAGKRGKSFAAQAGREARYHALAANPQYVRRSASAPPGALATKPPAALSVRVIVLYFAQCMQRRPVSSGPACYGFLLLQRNREICGYARRWEGGMPGFAGKAMDGPLRQSRILEMGQARQPFLCSLKCGHAKEKSADRQGIFLPRLRLKRSFVCISSPAWAIRA